MIVRENVRMPILLSTQKARYRFLIFPNPHQASNITPSTSTQITWHDGIVKRRAWSPQQRIGRHATSETSLYRGVRFSRFLRVALFTGRRGGNQTERILSSAPTRLLLSRVLKQRTNNTSTTNTMSSRPDVNESTEITSPRRTTARRGPRVSNACVNCRRRKVCGSGFPVARRTCCEWS